VRPLARTCFARSDFHSAPDDRPSMLQGFPHCPAPIAVVPSPSFLMNLQPLRFLATFTVLLAFAAMTGSAVAQIPGVRMPPEDGKLRIIAFGAHPDDCEIQVGGSAALWAKQGHHVLLVSTTNGDVGHWREAGGPLARRRKAEVDRAHEILGVQGVVLDIHDGEIEPTLENRRTLTRLIRLWNADLVLGPRTNDYHPDHRYTGVLMQDAAYMVTVPFFCPDVPAMKKNPVFMNYTDRFQKPAPSRADVVVAIDSVVEKKLDALGVMISQFAEGGANGNASLYPADPAGQQRRQQQVRENFSRRFQGTASRFNQELAIWYSGAAAKVVKHAEAFEICEYGGQPDPAELRRLFPF
jgi:LmbE family N-acetylglucosaminyl deacetylase